ncbi:anaerobic ribonucleoside-triphosphate reductase activating protein [Pseudidiomarina sp.]|uniref:anaerobic ribonucleoside-triphosphate reductase activating protein n=1 Tax=Pseudidiomarina sp. TaxID=2081707 RepID=UPI00299E11A2|nr:anaerobic ribonucleoside-triphosphate reductase activating protein [Pseudidiomarina sp.]MDX1705920.1 anaerobic ribonucleoside-triphosphate reductase activating protein [Pseudidiomarina sp.]
MLRSSSVSDHPLRYSAEQVVFQEVPGQVSLAYTITGCPVGCKGCHSVDSWPVGSGQSLTPEYLASRLQQYRKLISCVLFLGGEWQPQALIELLKLSREHGLHTCLYTGYDDVSLAIRQQLTFLKTGPWVEALGGLTSPTTNQRFVDLRNQQLLNSRFITD